MLFNFNSSLLNGQVKFWQVKYVFWHTCQAYDLEKKNKIDLWMKQKYVKVSNLMI